MPTLTPLPRLCLSLLLSPTNLVLPPESPTIAFQTAIISLLMFIPNPNSRFLYCAGPLLGNFLFSPFLPAYPILFPTLIYLLSYTTLSHTRPLPLHGIPLPSTQLPLFLPVTGTTWCYCYSSGGLHRIFSGRHNLRVLGFGTLLDGYCIRNRNNRTARRQVYG
jgi:hypothetical protein